MDAEQRERLELRTRARLGNYITAALRGVAPSGAEAELQAAAGAAGVPLELFDPVPERRIEQRADTATTAPATGTGVNLDPHPAADLCPAPVLPRMGVAMPRVPSGGYSSMTVTAGLSAGAMDPGAARESTAATLTPKTTTPHRVSARLSIRIEDVAAIGTPTFESALPREPNARDVPVNSTSWASTAIPQRRRRSRKGFCRN